MMEQADLDFQRKPVTKSQALEFTEFSIKCKKKHNQFWGTQTPPEFTKSLPACGE
jgi:hypothetical protein